MRTTTPRVIAKVKNYLAIKSRIELLEKQLKIAEKDCRAKVYEIAKELAEMGETSTGFIEGLGRFTVVKKAYPHCNKEAMANYIKVLESLKKDSIVEKTIPKKAFRAHIAESLKIMEDYYFRNPDLIIEGSTPEDMAKRDLSSIGISIFTEYSIMRRSK